MMAGNFMKIKNYFIIFSFLGAIAQHGIIHAGAFKTLIAPCYDLVQSVFVPKQTEQKKKDDRKKLENLLNSKSYKKAYEMLKNRKHDLKLFIDLIQNHCIDLSNDIYSGIAIIEFMITYLPDSSARGFAQSIADNIKDIHFNALVIIANTKIYDQIIDAAVVKLVNEGDGADLLKGLSYAYYLNKRNLPFKLTLTGIHLYQNSWALHRYPVDKYQNEPQLLDLLSDIIKKERELAAHGYYTFIHGQRRIYYLPSRIYTFLWQLHNQYQTKDFLFAHVKPLLSTEEEWQEEENVRNYLLAHGRKPQDNYTRQKLLFLNYGLFAQMNDRGSNTAHFIGRNINWGSSPITITCKDAFKFFGYEHIYNKYADEIEVLAKAYEADSFGNALMIAVPKDVIQEYVYLCQPARGFTGMGGVRRSIYIDGIGQTDDIQLIMDALCNNPERIFDTDDLEFCMIMTQLKGGLDPRTGIQVHPLISGNKVALTQLKEKEQQLLRSIESAIKAEQQTKNVFIK